MQLQKSLEEYQKIPKYVVVQKTLLAFSGAIFDHILKVFRDFAQISTDFPGF